MKINFLLKAIILNFLMPISLFSVDNITISKLFLDENSKVVAAEGIYFGSSGTFNFKETMFEPTEGQGMFKVPLDQDDLKKIIEEIRKILSKPKKFLRALSNIEPNSLVRKGNL